MNVKVTFVALRISKSCASCNDKRRSPKNNPTSSNAKAWSSEVVPVYSPGLRQKKNPRQIMLAQVDPNDEGETALKVKFKIERTTQIGNGLTRCLGASSFEYPRI